MGSRETNEIDNVIRQLASLFSPIKIILFGSVSKGIDTQNSDIDLCVVAETDNKRKLITDMYFLIDSEKPIDFLLYTLGEWESCILDKTSFAHKVNEEGLLLYCR